MANTIQVRICSQDKELADKLMQELLLETLKEAKPEDRQKIRSWTCEGLKYPEFLGIVLKHYRDCRQR